MERLGAAVVTLLVLGHVPVEYVALALALVSCAGSLYAIRRIGRIEKAQLAPAVGGAAHDTEALRAQAARVDSELRNGA
jgi:hypothetical protein